MILLNSLRLGESTPRANFMALITMAGPKSTDHGKRIGGIFMGVGSTKLNPKRSTNTTR